MTDVNQRLVLPAPRVPADVFPLQPWKLQLPALTIDGPPEEVKWPQLASFSRPDVFYLTADGGVGFRVRAADFAQRGSKYARAEVREMTLGGLQGANWSTTDGLHMLTICQKITELPNGRPAVVVGQIHGMDSSEYLVLIRLDGSKLWVKHRNKEVAVLDRRYELGQTFTVQIMAENGRCRVIHDGYVKADFELDAPHCYFKAGMYLQTNPRDYNESPDSCGAATLYKLAVSHTDYRLVA